MLIFSMLLAQLPGMAWAAEDTAAVIAQTPTAEAAAASAPPAVDPLELAKDSSILKYVDAEVFRSGNHIARLNAEETLSSYAFLNSDGSKTVYYLAEEVKYVDASGKIREKDLTLTSAVGGYTTASNDVGLTLPNNPANGISLTYGNYSISLIPQGGTLRKALALENNAVTYPDYFGEGIHLVYTPTANGVKEDIVLDAYTGVNSFTFMLNTRGLNLYQANGRYFLASGKGSELRFDLGDIVSFDAKGRFSIGTMTAETVSAGNLYRLTITVDKAFLTDENTAYPVSIDPTIDISDNTHGAGTITDATIYQGSPYLNTGGWQYMHCGYYDSSYQVGRVAYNLPGLLFNTTISGSNIISAVFHVGEATGSAGVAVKLHVITSNWTEDSITWNSHSNSYSSYVQATAYPSYNNFASYDITNIVTDWLTGDLPEYGFMLVSSNETSVDKAFYSSEYSSTAYRPYVAVNYTGAEIDPPVTTEGPTITQTDVDVDVGSTKAISVNNPSNIQLTWSSSNSSVASVSSTGVVTGHKVGTATITCAPAGYSNISCTVYVTLADGVYRITSKSAGLPIGTNGNILNTTAITTRNYSTANPDQLYQLWRIVYLSNNTYSIRPLYKLDRSLHASDNIADIWKTGYTDSYSDIPSSARWTITSTSNGYAIMQEGTSQKALSVSTTGTSAGINISVASYSSSSSRFHWEFSKISNPPSGVLLFDGSTGEIISNPLKYIALNEARALSSLGLEVSVYSGNNTTSQNLSWSSNNSCVYLDTESGSLQGVAAGTATITATCAYGSFTFRVEVLPFSNGTYYIRSWSSDKHIDIKDQVMASGTTIHQWDFHGGETQQWVFTHLGDGTFSIHSANSSTKFYLGVSGDSADNDEPIVLRTGEITPGMKWRISITASGAYTLTPLTGETCNRVLALEVGFLGSASANGDTLQQRDYIDDSNYKDEWLLCPVNSTPILEGQETNVWCWVASARIASTKYMRSPVSQMVAACHVKLNLRDFTPLENDAALAIQMGTPYESEEALRFILGADNTHTALFQIYSEETLRSLLDAGNVVICHRGNYVDGFRKDGHTVVIAGYHWNSQANVYMYDILDPWPPNRGESFSESYASFCNGQNALPGFEQEDTYIWESVTTFEIGPYQNTILWPGT